MLRDFFFIHADVFRNAFVMLCMFGLWSVVEAIIIRVHYRKRAIEEADEDLKQQVVEWRIRYKEARAEKADDRATIERLTQVQNTGVAAANAIKEAVRT